MKLYVSSGISYPCMSIWVGCNPRCRRLVTACPLAYAAFAQSSSSDSSLQCSKVLCDVRRSRAATLAHPACPSSVPAYTRTTSNSSGSATSWSNFPTAKCGVRLLRLLNGADLSSLSCVRAIKSGYLILPDADPRRVVHSFCCMCHWCCASSDMGEDISKEYTSVLCFSVYDLYLLEIVAPNDECSVGLDVVRDL